MFRALRAYARILSSWVSRRFPRTARLLGFARSKRRPLLRIFILVMHVIGFVQSIHAVMETRTPQGAIAWAISLNTVPYVAVPAYAVFGGADFHDYVSTRRAGLEEIRPMAGTLAASLADDGSLVEAEGLMETLASLSSLPVTGGNHAELLIDGAETFGSILQAIDGAEHYILVQFYIIRADATGNELKARLIAKAKEGVRVHVLYDDYGSLGLPPGYAGDLRDAGVEIRSFMNLGDDVNRYQLNYRNHRKLVVVDGEVGFVGGHNVGDEYLGKHPTLTPWRDTHVRLTGPIVSCLQVPFAEDWKWATGETLEGIRWKPGSRGSGAGGMQALCIPTGPADPMETCELAYLAAIHSARSRIWIATPYFVPDEPVIMALQLAARRGVEVKILIPELFDSDLVRYSSYSYLEPMDTAGAGVWRYQRGFLHQKVLLVDDDFAAIGSANFDNRSFRLNFELQVAVRDSAFAREVERMLEDDFAASRRASPDDLRERSGLFKLGVRIARLLAPIQ